MINQINIELEKMIKKGAILEVKRFIKLKFQKPKLQVRLLELREINEYLNKKMEISETIEKISIKTRQYAKRQSTWGRGHMGEWNKIKPTSLNKFLKKI